MITRRRILAATGGLATLAAGPAAAETASTRNRNGAMEIKRSGSQPSRKGPAENFTGAVRVDPLFQAPDPARVSGGSVTFEPGARTAWHTHPLGQTLIVTSGFGWVQHEGGPSPARRCGLVSARFEALAWSDADDRDDAHRHYGIAERQDRRLDGKGQRRPVSQVSPRTRRRGRERRQETGTRRWMTSPAARPAVRSHPHFPRSVSLMPPIVFCTLPLT